MSKKISFVLAGLLCAVCLGFVASQQEEKTFKQEQPELFMISIAHVKPAMAKQYEGAVKEIIRELTDYNVDPAKVSFHAVQGSELGYVFVHPLENFGAMESMHQNWEQAIESIGREQFKTLLAKADAATVSRERLFTKHRAELSYTPENPALKSEDVKFLNYKFIYVTPGQEETFEEVAKEFVAIYKKNCIDTGWNVYQSVTGTDLPLFVIIEAGKSRAQFAVNEERIKAKLAEQTKELGQKAVTCFRKVVHKEGYPRPDLSYPTPETE